MKTTFISLALFASLIFKAQAADEKMFRAQYSYVSADLAPNIVFRLYLSRTQLVPSTNWTVVAVQNAPIASTNLITTNIVSFLAGPGWNRVSMTASNEWMESAFSGVVAFNPAGSPKLIRVDRE